MIKLPKNKNHLARILWNHSERADAIITYRRTNWLLAWYYLNGYRRFDVYNPSTGEIQPHFLDEEGNMEFQSQHLLWKINQTAGIFQGMDLRPKVESDPTTLGSMQSRAVGQIIADSVASENQIDIAKESFAYTLSCLGGCGIAGHITNVSTIGLTNDIEAIHPKELYPFPSMGENSTHDQGIMRVRMMTMHELKDRFGDRIERHKDKLEWYEVDPGSNWRDRSDHRETDLGSTNLSTLEGNISAVSGVPSDKVRETIPVVRVRELWQKGPHGTVVRYIVSSGEYIIEDQDLSDLVTYCPIGYARFINNGTWWGAGMFDLMYSHHRQFEMLTKSLYNNIRDIDRYGILVMPQGEFNKNAMLKDVGRGLRTLFWQPDPMNESFTPFPITPFNSGDMPGKVAAFAQEQMEAVSPVRDLLEEKGRVDSHAGLSFLDEQIQKSVTTATANVSRAWGEMWRASTQKATTQLMVTKNPIPVRHLTLDLAGARIDAKTDTITFSNNPIPNLPHLSFKIQDVSPGSKVARKMEALRMFELGLEQDPVNFRLMANEEGLDFPLWDEDKYAYQACVKQILILYGDGETPQLVLPNVHTTKVELMLRLINMFMTGPAMQMASQEVIQAFVLIKQWLISSMGMTLPSAVPNPDDMALLQQSAAVSGQQGLGPETAFQAPPQLPQGQ